jgi:Papain family cysteine protease
MTAGQGGLTIRIDLRKAWKIVRDQGGRSACLACAASDAHAHAHERRRPLSAEFLFYHAAQLMPGKDVTAGLTFPVTDSALQMQGQPDEDEWPYSVTPPSPWNPPTVTTRWYGSLHRSANAADVVKIVSSIESRQPVVLGVRLTTDFYTVTRDPFVIPAFGPGFGGHAVLGVGVADYAPVGELILIRNSWGPTWGDKGYAWLPTVYLRDKLIDYRTVVASNPTKRQ